MFQFLYIFGPAAVTFIVAKKISGKDTHGVVEPFIEVVAYAAIDAALTTLLLLPVGRVEFIVYDSGIRELQYGIIAFSLSLLLAVIVGVAISVVEKRTDIQIEITKEEHHEKNSKKRSESCEKE